MLMVSAAATFYSAASESQKERYNRRSALRSLLYRTSLKHALNLELRRQQPWNDRFYYYYLCWAVDEATTGLRNAMLAQPRRGYVRLRSRSCSSIFRRFHADSSGSTE